MNEPTKSPGAMGGYQVPARFRLQLVERDGTRTVEIDAKRLSWGMFGWWLDGEPITLAGYEVIAWRDS
jgi:hypothetical protein